MEQQATGDAAREAQMVAAYLSLGGPRRLHEEIHGRLQALISLAGKGVWAYVRSGPYHASSVHFEFGAPDGLVAVLANPMQGVPYLLAWIDVEREGQPAETIRIYSDEFRNGADPIDRAIVRLVELLSA